GLLGDGLHARPGKALAADADAVAHRAAIAENQIEIRVGRVDDDGAGRLMRGVVDDLALEAGGLLGGRRLLLMRVGAGAGVAGGLNVGRKERERIGGSGGGERGASEGGNRDGAKSAEMRHWTTPCGLASMSPHRFKRFKNRGQDLNRIVSSVASSPSP